MKVHMIVAAVTLVLSLAPLGASQSDEDAIVPLDADTMGGIRGDWGANGPCQSVDCISPLIQNNLCGATFWAHGQGGDPYALPCYKSEGYTSRWWCSGLGTDSWCRHMENDVPCFEFYAGEWVLREGEEDVWDCVCHWVHQFTTKMCEDKAK